MLSSSRPCFGTLALRASMPPRYRATFDPVAIGEHAAIVSRRGGPVHVEIWKLLGHGRAILCVVADDRPGLLSLICASLVSSGMNVIAAQAYTRSLGEGRGGEAVDFFTVERDADHPLPVSPADVALIGDTLGQLLDGRLTTDAIVRHLRPPRPVPAGASTHVTFDTNSEADLGVLMVETFDRTGLLLAITQALFEAGVQIVATDASSHGGRVVDRFVVEERSGGPVRAARRGLVQMHVLAAVDALLAVKAEET